MNRSSVILAVVCGVMGAGACSLSRPEAGGTDSSTHWLMACEHDRECGELACVCGVCSAICRDDLTCRAFGSAASCAPSSDSLCSAPTSICDHPCERDEQCTLASARCVDGRCRKGVASAPQLDAGEGTSDAHTGGDGDAAEPPAGEPDASAPVAPLSCASQLASSAGTCAESRGFAWTGFACEEVLCACAGADCGELFSDRTSCLERHAHCFPESTCGLRWFECAEACPAYVSFGGGRSLPNCVGDCRFELSLQPTFFLDTNLCHSMTARLNIRNSFGVDSLGDAMLTDDAWQEAALIMKTLLEEAPPAQSECPNCTGEEHWVTRFGSEMTEAASWRYAPGAPPPAVRAADHFVQRLLDQMRSCRGDLLSSCAVLGTGLNQGTIGPACGRTVNNESCTCPSDFDPLATTPQACDGSCGTCTQDKCGASCLRSCTTGEATWEGAWCSE